MGQMYMQTKFGSAQARHGSNFLSDPHSMAYEYLLTDNFKTMTSNYIRILVPPVATNGESFPRTAGFFVADNKEQKIPQHSPSWTNGIHPVSIVKVGAELISDAE